MGGTPSFPKSPLPQDRLYVVTGGNTGIGYETAKWIAMLGARVIIACRSEERAIKAIEKMNVEFEEEKKRGTEGIISEDSLAVEFMKLDCASLKSTQEFIDNFKSKESKLHVLVCNAGVAIHKQEYTEDGYELMFQVNYLSQFLITTKLLPMMKESGDDCRIVLVSSSGHAAAVFDMDKIQGKTYNENNFPRLQYYGNSKAYQIMQMFSMNRILKNTNVAVTSVHPGMVDTEVSRSFSDTMWSTFFKFGKFTGISKTPFQGAVPVIYAAINADIDVRDVYYADCKAQQPKDFTRNKDNQDKLWRTTLDCLKSYLKEDDLKQFQTEV